MGKGILLLFLVTLLGAYLAQGHAVIKGKITGFKNGTKIFLKDDETDTTLDSAVLKKVERSTDGGISFTTLGLIPASFIGKYSFADNNPIIGQNLYRLKQQALDNSVIYSKTILIWYETLSDQKNGTRLNIFPNPASSQINLAIMADTQEAAAYKVSFSSSMGGVVREFTLSQSAWQGNVNDLLPGTYLVTVVNNKTQAFVAQGKFVKL